MNPDILIRTNMDIREMIEYGRPEGAGGTEGADGNRPVISENQAHRRCDEPICG